MVNAIHSKTSARITVLELELGHVRTISLADDPDLRIAAAEREKEISTELKQLKGRKAGQRVRAGRGMRRPLVTAGV